MDSQISTLPGKWYSELCEMWPGQSFSLEVEEMLYEGKSEFQEIKCFRSKTYGNVLVLDGVIQATERDEFSYQEMLVHPALLSHPNPEKVLVIGGGDGGCLREIARHPSVKEIHICELDQLVIDTAKKYIPSMACGFEDPRVNVHILDGYQFMLEHKNEYDIIIVDSADPVGPAKVLFMEPFYKAMSDALKPSGIAVAQAVCMWLHLEEIDEILKFAKNLFARCDFGYVSTPTYPCGNNGILFCAKNEEITVQKPHRKADEKLLSHLRYYTPKIHRACLILPSFVEKKLKHLPPAFDD